MLDTVSRGENNERKIHSVFHRERNYDNGSQSIPWSFLSLAGRLGFGKLEACQYRFDAGMNPWINHDVFESCLGALTSDERRRMELHYELTAKCLRLSKCLTEEEKEAVKEYNRLTISLRYDWNKEFNFSDTSEVSQEDLDRAEQCYLQIMAKYGEKVY